MSNQAAHDDGVDPRLAGHDRGRHRWRLHRGGIVNIWQYADRTFDLDGGRAIFQGTNGSGKSRTLELLLPLCLDGDLRQVGSKGFDTVSVRRLMLDEYPGGPNRIGYAWIELRREIAPGPDEPADAAPGEEFLTCGIGVKASKTSQQISDSWRFITSRRVGHDVNLIGPGDVPLGPTQLRELLGADCVLDEQTFRARVAATVYGVPAARYGDLLHLQRTLRNPDVGLKVLEGQLEQILSDALPPLDAGLIERLATSFDDLESIRENIVALGRADDALSAFLATYSGYALTSLRERARAMRGESERSESLRRELNSLEQQLDEHHEQRAAAEGEVSELERRETEIDSSLDALRSRPAYTEMQNLRDRRAVVDGARSAAVNALETAARHRAQEQRSVESVVGALRRLSTDTESARTACERAGERLAAAGLDTTLVPAPPAVPAAQATVTGERVRAEPEADAEPHTIERHAPPELDTAHVERSLRGVVTGAEEADTAARQRAALTLALHEQAVSLDGERAAVTEAQRLARQAQLATTEATGRRNQADQQLSDAAANWIEELRTWLRTWPVDESDSPHQDGSAQNRLLHEQPDVDELLADRTVTRRCRDEARRRARPHVEELRGQAGEVERELTDLRSRIATLDDELATLRAGHERSPAPPGGSDTDERGGPGAAFHRLVDFADELSDADRAGLEAALESCGLLNAWVSPDGRVTDPRAAELVAAPGQPADGRNLAELLIPAPEPGCPVAAERVAALLESVAIDAADAALAVSTDGNWRAGVLSGTARKDTAEYVGAGAREAARARRIAELEAELSDLRTASGDADKRYREAGDRAAELERHLDRFPDDEDLLTAHAKVAGASEAVRDAEREAARLREEHDLADARWQASRAELVRSAGEAGLSPETDALDAAHRAANEVRSAITDVRDAVEGRCLSGLADLREAWLHHDAAVADRMAAEEQAEQRSTEFRDEATALEELTSTVGDEGREVAEKVAELEADRADVRTRLPQAREQVATLRESTVKLQTRQESKQARLTEVRSEAEAAGDAFRQALRVPGLWAAAGLDGGTSGADAEGTPPPDPEHAADIVLAATGTSATDKDVYNKLHTLQQALSGSYDITAGEQHGLLTITVTGEDGPRPVAESARLVSDRLTRQRGYLDERYQSIFADYLIRDLAERLRGQITVAEDLCRRMNEVLDGARSSQGVHVQLEWEPSPALGDDVRRAIDLVRTPFADRTAEQDALLRRVFTDLIESERDSATGGYAEILARALDYRAWYRFTVRVRDTGPEGKPRVRRLRQLSSGETRLVSYVTLFAAAAAFYDAVSVVEAGQGPLRLVLLDEAFERLDDPTVARMLGLLVDLDMDWMITWPSGWGVSAKIPKMHIYDVLRPRSGHGIACTHTTWDGHGLERTEL